MKREFYIAKTPQRGDVQPRTGPRKPAGTGQGTNATSRSRRREANGYSGCLSTRSRATLWPTSTASQRRSQHHGNGRTPFGVVIPSRDTRPWRQHELRRVPDRRHHRRQADARRVRRRDRGRAIGADITVKCFHRTSRTGSNSSRAPATPYARRS